MRHAQLRKPYDLLQRYGEGQVGKSWAVVTGASDGIGAAYSELLAKAGFNVCLVSRSFSKLEAVAKRCKDVNPKVQTKIVQADFSNALRPKKNDILSFYHGLRNELDSLDIAILINNAGVMYTGNLDSFPADAPRWKEMLDIDVLHVGMMTALFKDKLIARQASGKGVKSALINVSSAIAYLQGTAGAAVYGAAKGYVTCFTTATAWELKDKLDMQCLTPNLTKTGLLDDITRNASPLFAIPAIDCARGSLRDLGYDMVTAGDIRHDIQIPPYRLISEWPVTQYIFGFALRKFFNH